MTRYYRAIAPLLYAGGIVLAAWLIVFVMVKSGHAQRAESPVPHVDAKTTAQMPRKNPRARRKGAYSTSRDCLPASLKAKLKTIESRWGKVRIVSTFRRGAVIAGSGKASYHASCRAVDFHPPKGTYRAVARWLKSSHTGGVGTYSGGHTHIHIDAGPRVHYHHCYSRKMRKVRCGR